MTKDENTKEVPEVVKSRSTRHALERVLKAVQLHLPPDGISERDAMGMIIEAVDPMPDDFDSEKCIKEVMELVESHGFECALRRAASTQGNYRLAKEFEDKAVELFDRIESKLRELIQ